MANGGARPGAGRKGYYDEAMVKKIIGSANRIIFNTLEGKGKYSDVPLEVIIEVATRFALKAIPQAVDVESKETKYTEIIHKVEGLSTGDLRSIIDYRRNRTLSPGTLGASEIGQAIHKDENR